jgi:hypothetical protein
MLGDLPPNELSVVLREYGYIDEADNIDDELNQVVTGTKSFGAFGWGGIFEKEVPAWKHTAHAFGCIPSTQSGKRLVEIIHPGNIKADDKLINGRVTIRLNSLRVADYPGKGMHQILFDFQAQNYLEHQKENIRFSQTYRAQEGESVGIIGYPVFVGLGVGNEGVSFNCSTINAKNENDENIIKFLDSDAFKYGLQLTTTAQPAIAPLAAMATNLVRMIAGRHRDIAVQSFRMGLDFATGPGGARLTEGLYIAVQIPQKDEVVWEWDKWVYDQTNGHIVHKIEQKKLIPFNFISFMVSESQ